MKKVLLLLLAMFVTLGAYATEVTYTASGLTGSSDPYTWTPTDCPFNISIKKNNGSTAPTYNTKGKDIRIYAKGTIEIASKDGEKITGVVFDLSAQGLKRLAPITASEGTVAAQASGDKTVTWTGDATSVTFTVGNNANYGSDGSSKAGQLCFSTVTITYQPVGPAKTPSEITFPEATYTAYLGKEFTAPAATKVAGDGAITYASENEAVATVNAETGAVTLVAGGSTKITATIAATETYAKATASYTLTVVDFNNTAVFNSPMGEEFTFDGQTETYPWTHDNQYGLKGTGYINDKNTACDAYAVSPMIDLTMVAEAKLTFDEAFNMYKTITVDKVSEYATIEVKEEGKDWVPLAKPTSPASFSWTFFANDPVDLSAYKGKKIQIGFRYVSTTSVAGTWEIKNIKVEGKFTVPVPVCQNWRDNLQPGDEIVWTVPEIEGLELHVRTMQNIFETTDALAAQAAEEIPEGWRIDGYTATYTVPASLQSLPGYQVYATYNGVLEGEASNLSIGANGNTSGVEDLEVVEDAEVEFFNLQGVRVEGELTPGLYIRRQGNQATKVVVK